MSASDLPDTRLYDLPERDFSTSNPRLHRLYVTYAQEDLRDFQQCIDILAEHSRVNRAIMAGLIVGERNKLIRSDAAYREAAWRVLADDLLERDPVDHGVGKAEGQSPAAAGS